MKHQRRGLHGSRACELLRGRAPHLTEIGGDGQCHGHGARGEKGIVREGRWGIRKSAGWEVRPYREVGFFLWRERRLAQSRGGWDKLGRWEIKTNNTYYHFVGRYVLV